MLICLKTDLLETSRFLGLELVRLVSSPQSQSAEKKGKGSYARKIPIFLEKILEKRV